MKKRWWLYLLATPLVALLLGALVLYAITPSIDNIRKTRHDEPAHLVSTDGRLLAEYHWVNRQWVPLDHIAPAVVDALIATEDHRFYQHSGLDWQRTLASVVHTLAGKRQGGSTLTQQLARNLFPREIGRSPTLTRKLKEAMTAFKIEASHSKKEILETYLNTVPFLYNAWGIEMAARTYFDQSADQLTLLESATLVGMLKGSSYYNPVLHPERAEKRRNTVLAQMKKRGKLTATQYEELIAQPLSIRFSRQKSNDGLAPHLAQYLHNRLIDWADRNGYSLYFDGLVIHTTVNGQLQEMAAQALQRHSLALQAVADEHWVTRGAWQVNNPLVQTIVRESNSYRNALTAQQSPDTALAQLLHNTDFLHTLRWNSTRVHGAVLAIHPGNGSVSVWIAPQAGQGGQTTLFERLTRHIPSVPHVITHIEDRHGNVLETFSTHSGENTAPPLAGESIKGKDWMILQHPQLLAGARLGFSDPRITWGNAYWEQPEHSVLPILGPLFQQALHVLGLEQPAAVVGLEPAAAPPSMPQASRANTPLLSLEVIELQPSTVDELDTINIP